MKIFNIIEIKLITKRQIIIDTLGSMGYIKAIKKCKDLHDWSLGDSVKYVKKLRLKYPTFEG
jgi:hypothetical protein